jgi:hypothetical protein
MTLEELAAIRPYAKAQIAPDWTLGCWRRRCITFANGEEDTDTQAIRVRSQGLTAEIRAPKMRPPLIGKHHLGDCSDAELARLARAEGLVAQTAWRDGLMAKDVFASFQPYDRWPEPGRLERVGVCLTEWAPSGAYVEDWRLQPRSSGLSAGLRLVSEIRLDGREHPRDGGLVIAGDHALMVIGRREPMQQGRAWELIEQADDPLRPASLAFDCRVSYAIRMERQYAIALAIDPFANGLPLFLEHGFDMGEAEDELVQRPGPGDLWNLRRWKIDTLLPDQRRPRATPMTESGAAWLEAERSSFLSP